MKILRLHRDHQTRQKTLLFLSISLLIWTIADHNLKTSKFLISMTILLPSLNKTKLNASENAVHNNGDCLIHVSQNISAGWKIDGGILQQETFECGKLRRQWKHNPPQSNLAKEIEKHQSDCSIPIATHHLDNTYGLGSHLILWGQAMCNAMEQGYRLHSAVKTDFEFPQWIWLDQEYCGSSQYEAHPMTCYFPFAEEEACPHHSGRDPSEDRGYNYTKILVQDPRAYRCALTQKSINVTDRDEYRASATEYLFSQLSPLVIQEARRQVGVVFGDLPNTMAPGNLITVHIRWGDKFWEMDLVNIGEYIDAIRSLIQSDPSLVGPDGQVHIYLATEDPKAHDEFVKAVPSHWKVYADVTLQEINSFRPVKGNRASHATRNTKGRAGLVAMGSLLVALEAKAYVLTTKSNFSTLINHLRKNIVNRQCRDENNDKDTGECTVAIDLRPDVW